MNKLKNRIYINQWLDFKPYERQAPTDFYYLNICNEIKQSVHSDFKALIILRYLEKEDIDRLSCFLTSYFEDLISETNLWNTFVKIHKRLYNKPLPFYDVTEYYEKEINFQDISFLIWYFANTIQLKTFIAPFNEFILEISKRVFEIFDREWEYAPENEALKPFYFMEEAETDFYIARSFIDNILFNSYLFYPDTWMNLKDKESEVIKKDRDNEHLLDLLKDARDFVLHKSYTRLLGLKGNEWVAEILGENHPLSKDFTGLSPKITGYFLYKGQDRENIFIEHIASGKKFDLTKKSFDYPHLLTETDTVLFIGIVRWQHEWWFSGVYFQTKYDPKLVTDEKNSLGSKKVVDFLDYQDPAIKSILKNQLKTFKEFNHGSQIAFMDSGKINPFIKDYITHYNNSLNATKEKREEAMKRAREGGFFDDDELSSGFTEEAESGIVFFNPKSGTEIAFGVNSAFPVPENPFYDKNESEEAIFFLLSSEELSTELALYCVNNFKSDLAFFQTKEGKGILENFDFLLRFWKKGHYYSQPSITLTGGQQPEI